MSQYDIVFDEKSNTVTLKNEADKPRKASIGHIRADKIGELSSATVHPAPGEFLKLQMENRGIDYSLVTVVNETDNDRLDSLVKTGREITDADRTVKVITSTDEDGVVKGEAGNDTHDSGAEMRAPSEA